MRAFDFDALFAASDDPWSFDGSWYEARKRDLLLACLPRRRYRAAFEPGCATGLLTRRLMRRCDVVLAWDTAAAAVRQTRDRLARAPGSVRVEVGTVPDDWPDDRFDLVVISELAYYLSPAAVDALADRIRASLADDGTVLACHWRHRIDGCALDGDAVHDRLASRLALPYATRLVEADVRVEVWTADGATPARREGRAG